MSANLSVLAADLLNKAKLCTDVSSKLFNLEQVKELIFHRNRALLAEIFPELCDMMTERSVKVRKFLVQTAEDALNAKIDLAIHVLPLYSFLISDGNDKILTLIATSITKHYDNIAVFIASMSAKGGNARIEPFRNNDPKDLWHHLRSITSLLLDTINSGRSEALRVECIRLSEAVVLFGLPAVAAPAPAVRDPRMARTVVKHTVLAIPLHHSFIDPNDIQRDADATLSRLVLWTRRGGPQEHPFSHLLLVSISQTIGNIAAERPHALEMVIPAILHVVQGKDSKCGSMLSSNRQLISNTLIRLIRAVQAVDGASPHITNLRGAMQALEVIENESSATAGTKRKLEDFGSDSEEEDEVLPGVDAEDEETEEQALRAAALQAIDVAASKQSSSSSSVVAPIVLTDAAVTHLSGDLGMFASDMTTSFRLVTLHKEVGLHAKDSQQKITLSPVPPPPEVYYDLAIGNLSKMLHHLVQLLDDTSSINDHITWTTKQQSIVLCLQLTLRLTLSMSYNDLCHGGPCCSRVLVLTSIAKLPRNLKEKPTPADVVLPRSLWLLVSYFLNLKDFGADIHSIDDAEAPLSKADVMLFLLREIYNRDATSSALLRDSAAVPLNVEGIVASGTATLTCNTLYDLLCYVIISRALHRKDMRPFANYMIGALPEIPLLCIHLLERLVYSGPLAAPSAHVAKRREKEKSVRTIAMEMLGNVFQLHRNHTSTAVPCLNVLLWCAVSSDFECRSRAVAILAGAFNRIEIGINDRMMLLFSVHAVLACVNRELLQNQGLTDFADKNVTVESFIHSCSPLENLLSISFQLFDNGTFFDGAFESLPNSDITSYLRQHIHLVCQLCLSCLELIAFLFDLYGLLVRASADSIEHSHDGDIHHKALQDLIYSEVLNILPTMARHFTTEAVFACISQRHPSTYPLVLEALDILTRDYSLPASTGLVNLVQSFRVASKSESYRILVPVLSGLSAENILTIVPKLIEEFGEADSGLEVLRSAFHRIVEARPPPLSRSTLLIALHRIDYEALGLKRKSVLEAISVCLGSKDIFNAEVLRETLGELLKDEHIPIPFMRTVILATQAMPEMKKFVLHDVIPKLVSRQVWDTAPKIWDGVVMFMKSAIGHRDAEPAIRSILGLPYVQLHAILKLIPAAKSVLANVLTALSREEFEEVVRGYWAGLANPSDDDMIGTATPEKMKIIEGLLKHRDAKGK